MLTCRSGVSGGAFQDGRSSKKKSKKNRRARPAVRMTAVFLARHKPSVVSSLLAPSVLSAGGGGSGRELVSQLAESIFINCYNRIYAVPRADRPCGGKMRLGMAFARRLSPLRFGLRLACGGAAGQLRSSLVYTCPELSRLFPIALRDTHAHAHHARTRTRTHTEDSTATFNPPSRHARHITQLLAQNKPSSSTPSWRLRSRRRMLPWASR